MQYRENTYASGVWDVFWYDKNLLGDIVAVYDSRGDKLVSYEYNAFGRVYTTYHNGGGSTAAAKNPFRYRGYYYDTDLGMYYLQTRYYDPKICRFISPDDVSYLGANGDLVSYNLYAYCSNDPVNYVDPSGHSILAVLLIGIVVVMPLAFAVSTIISDLEDTGGEPEIFGKRVIDSESSDAYSPYFEYETLDVFGVRYGAAFEAGLYTQVSKENEYKGANFDVLKVDANITMFGGGAGVYILEHTWTQKNINIFGHEVKLSVSANVGAGAKLQLGKRSVIGLSFGPGFKFTADF